MAQNIYDDPAFFALYSRLPRQVDGLDGAPEWPSVRAMLPELSGLHVLDLGCGLGWFARWARRQGAASVLGIDLSETMIAAARAATDDPAITYLRADLETEDLPEGAFDFCYSSLALHYLADFGRLVRRVHASLRHGSSFVFTIEHPIYMAASDPEWMQDARGQRNWPVRQYGVEGPRRSHWLGREVQKYHRTIASTMNSLRAAGFDLRQVAEFAPTQRQISENAALIDESERPMFLSVSASR